MNRGGPIHSREKELIYNVLVYNYFLYNLDLYHSGGVEKIGYIRSCPPVTSTNDLLTNRLGYIRSCPPVTSINDLLILTELVLQLQGDQRENICQFLTKVGLVKADQIKVHGF
ncbi:Protein translation factor SUI1 [Portunus trituberculatus]|uniref:Protein translation factor SUI1 n=1 Tax=Portunus trituberculatus TaxID=210409 RepID=A0A5B7HW11_PORTR|nr:Protein translation factor SUI1 [Portunus trituberculatus]